MNAIHKQRLLKLATFLREKVPNEHFNLNYFIDAADLYSNRHIKDLPRIAAGLQSGCGTTACAVGWCPAVFKQWEWCARTVRNGGVRLRGTSGTTLQDAERFFGLSVIESLYLFHPHEYPENGLGKLHVARRIEQFVKRGGMPKARRT